MASFPNSKLTALQGEVLAAFFQRERDFFLTVGAALAGFHLGHRMTDDLDLFTRQAPAFERGRYVLADVATALGGELHVRQDAPGFRRLVLIRGEEGVVIDPPDEILANKLAALVGRAEERDLVDVMFLERAGYSVEAALPVALEKDGGCTPATLAWLVTVQGWRC